MSSGQINQAHSFFNSNNICFHKLSYTLLREVVRNLPDEENLIEILTEISGKTCRNGSQAGEIDPLEKAAQTALNAASRLELSQFGDSETLVEVAGIEPASRNLSDPASTRVVHLII